MSARPVRRFRHLSFAALLVLSGACSQTFDATRLGIPVTMSSPASAPPVGSKFAVRGKVVYGLWGLWPISSPSLQRTLATQLAGGKGVANLKIKVRSRLSDVVMTGLTLGLLVPRTVTYEGIIVEPTTEGAGQ